ncbi:MAG TPA: biopolymer transporter ExbD [Chthoniobacter sp.]|nr:biopolymer transporter ExbD [Chthoniobacter sp.]
MSPQTLREKAQLRLGPEDGPEFQIAPMIDILLVLFVFFMSISSTEVLQRRNNVVLPVAQGQSGADSSQATLNITWSSINQTGDVEIDGRHFAQAAQMRDYLRTKTQVSPEIRVLIRADRDVRYDFLRPIMIAVSETGVSKITFAVVGQTPASAPNP